MRNKAIPAELTNRELLIFFVLISISVSIFNLYAASFDVVIRNDFTLLQSHAHPLTIEKIFGHRGLPLTTIINNSIFEFIFPVSPKLARVLIVVFCMIPLSFLLFLLYRSYFRIPAMGAFAAALLPNISPNQTLIPVFINGSYITYALIPFIAFTIYGLKEVTTNQSDSIKYLTFTAILLILFLLSTELAFFLLIPAVIVFVLLSTNKKRMLRLMCVIAAITALKLLWYWSLSRHGANALNPTTTHEIGSRAMQLLQGILPLNSSGLDNSYIIFTFIVIMFSALLLSIHFLRQRVGLMSISSQNTSLDRTHEFYIGVAVIFGFTWVIASSIPYVFLSSHTFSDRYAYASGIGFSLILVVCPLYVWGYKQTFIRIFSILLLALVIASGVQRIYMLTRTYQPIENFTRYLQHELAQKDFPEYSQVVIVGKDVEVLRTNGTLVWSTGFLQHTLKREHIRGLIGPKYSFYDPFKPWYGFLSDRMTGLSTDFPLFLYEYIPSSKVLKQYGYALTYIKDTGSWSIFKVGKTYGRVRIIAKGKNKSSLEEEIKKLKSRGIDSDEIFWLFGSEIKA